jgi:ankyrin repeat protein
MDMDMEAAEAAVAAHAQARVQAMLENGAYRVLPPVLLTVLRRPKTRVRPCTSSTASADLQCHAPYAAFCQMRVGVATDSPVRHTYTSEFGVQKDAEYRSARELGEALVGSLDEEGSREVVADVRVREDGCLLITTQLHMRRQRALGKLHCVACGRFFLGERGLRDHQHIKHTHDYGQALDAVAAAKGTIVRYTDIGPLAELWAARAAEGLRERKALPASLEAARDGDLAQLQILAEGGWSARDDVDRHGSTALHFAAGSGHLAVVRYLVVDLDVPATQTQSRDGRTALHWAARNGHAEVCRWLIGAGVDPNVGTKDGTRPLHWAIWQRQLKVCELLLEAQADLHVLNAFGCNASQWAAQTAEDDPALCAWLLARGLDIGVLNRNGHSAIHKAAVKGNKRICEWLLSEGGLGLCHLGADGDGNTPALMAQLEGHTTLATQLDQAAHRLTESALQPADGETHEGSFGRVGDEQETRDGNSKLTLPGSS